MTRAVSPRIRAVDVGDGLMRAKLPGGRTPCPANWSRMTACLHPDGDGHEGLCRNGRETWPRRTSWFTDDYDYKNARFKDAKPSTTSTQTVGADMTTTADAPAVNIATAEHNHVMAQSVARMYAMDLDDAKGDLERAKAEHNRVTVWHASVSAYGAPQHIRDAVASLIDPAAQTVAAANERVAAASDSLAKIRAVVESAAEDAQRMGRAFGPWYGNGGQR